MGITTLVPKHLWALENLPQGGKIGWLTRFVRGPRWQFDWTRNTVQLRTEEVMRGYMRFIGRR